MRDSSHVTSILQLEGQEEANNRARPTKASSIPPILGEEPLLRVPSHLYPYFSEQVEAPFPSTLTERVQNMWALSAPSPKTECVAREFSSQAKGKQLRSQWDTFQTHVLGPSLWQPALGTTMRMLATTTKAVATLTVG